MQLALSGGMPRIPRACTDGHVLHILNRGNGRSTVFHDDADYRAFLHQLEEGLQRFPVDVHAFVLMPNHFHLVVRPGSAETLSDWMQWWMTSQVRRHHQRYETSGHIWQGRFKSFPIQEDEHFLGVARYVLLNPVRAHLVASPGAWRWSSLHFPELTAPWPVDPPVDAESWFADGSASAELDRIRESIDRRRPFGAPWWQAQVASENDLMPSLRPRGRPPRATVPAATSVGES